MDRISLERRWLELTRILLPAAAAERGWPVRLDHCFQRILLDNACGCRWYDVVAGRPAYRAAPDPVLLRSVELAEAVLSGAVDLPELNRNSLVWRGKVPKSRWP